LNDPVKRPDCSETDFTKDSMMEMASALTSMNLGSWQPLVDAEASDKSCRVAHNAALSRRCPIQDATDYWNPQDGRSSQVTESGGPTPGQDSHGVDT
jgi:hypothetical protein